MRSTNKVPQLFLRLALGIGLLSAVADRVGCLGPAGQHCVDWGNWGNFVTYTNTLLPFLNRSMAGVMGLIATIAEVLFGIQLIVGYKTTFAAMGTCHLTLIFALCMAIFLGVKSPLNYSVFAFSAGSLLLATVPVYHWSVDELLARTIKSTETNKQRITP